MIMLRGNLSTMKLLRLGVYSWVIFNTLVLLPKHELFWSSSAAIPAIETANMNWFEKSLHLLHTQAWSEHYLWFVAGLLLFSSLAAFNRLPYLASALVYFFSMNLDNKAYSILDGGNNLMQIFS